MNCDFYLDHPKIAQISLFNLFNELNSLNQEAIEIFACRQNGTCRFDSVHFGFFFGNCLIVLQLILGNNFVIELCVPPRNSFFEYLNLFSFKQFDDRNVIDCLRLECVVFF